MSRRVLSVKLLRSAPRSSHISLLCIWCYVRLYHIASTAAIFASEVVSKCTIWPLLSPYSQLKFLSLGGRYTYNFDCRPRKFFEGRMNISVQRVTAKPRFSAHWHLRMPLCFDSVYLHSNFDTEFGYGRFITEKWTGNNAEGIGRLLFAGDIIIPTSSLSDWRNFDKVM